MDHRLKERIDRGMFTQPWIQRFSHAKLINLVITMSNHASILMDLNLRSPVNRCKCFLLKNAWLKETDCKRLLIMFGDVIVGFTEKLIKCATSLQVWGSKKIQDFQRHIL